MVEANKSSTLTFIVESSINLFYAIKFANVCFQIKSNCANVSELTILNCIYVDGTQNSLQD